MEQIKKQLENTVDTSGGEVIEILIPEQMRTPDMAIALTLLELHGRKAYDILQRYDYNFDNIKGVDEMMRRKTI